MARKVYYSKPLKYFWQYLYGTQKKLTPNFTDDQIFALLRQNILAAPITAFETQDYRQVIISGLELWREDSRGALLHIFFLDGQLRDFLEATSMSICFSSITIFSIFPVIITLLRESKNRDNILKIINQLNHDWVISYHENVL